VSGDAAQADQSGRDGDPGQGRSAGVDAEGGKGHPAQGKGEVSTHEPMVAATPITRPRASTQDSRAAGTWRRGGYHWRGGGSD
jgi:hypothetical protein